ncbi:ferrichrome ABC transporter permease [Gracilibacillus halophilus YIM-C55.5]|uniref:Ferrichrome ABC transporter permease n=1 Tax=Gracilibacillus halophilus YIM-C55.5 TaxID=1308866 RepID=N4WFY3_9BACI|nr:iron ABC transporter permease [Gracilibacillus halophilus]ENH98184.1 ferrichrome ABC transporter permease [Gracilibacillus halophilus YIM-C55.5]
MQETNRLKSRPQRFNLIFIIIGFVLLFFALMASITYGATDINITTVWNSIFQFHQENSEHLVIRDIRLPRGIGSVFVGAFLATAGAIMQGMTRNPLASPSIMGVTDGAAFGLVIALAFFPSLSNMGQTFAAFIGAGLTVIAVFMIGNASRGGLTPVKLALAGVAIGTFVQSFTSIISLHFQLEKQLSFWIAGGLANTTWTSVYVLGITGSIGFILALLIAHSLTLLSLGDDVASGLGQRNVWIKFVAIIAVFILTGAAVTTAGAVGFIGLIVPHIMRFLVGTDYRWIIPSSAIFGALLLVIADILARTVNAPFETPVGAITSIIGVPFFLYLARGRGGANI